MERDDIEALRESVRLLRATHDGIETMAHGGPHAMTASTRDELRRDARHIDDYFRDGETVIGDGFTIVLTE